jgi:hypothetical protein
MHGSTRLVPTERTRSRGTPRPRPRAHRTDGQQRVALVPVHEGREYTSTTCLTARSHSAGCVGRTGRLTAAATTSRPCRAMNARKRPSLPARRDVPNRVCGPVAAQHPTLGGAGGGGGRQAFGRLRSVTEVRNEVWHAPKIVAAESADTGSNVWTESLHCTHRRLHSRARGRPGTARVSGE